MSSTDLAAPLLAWYAETARKLPWRGSADPYAVWVSEIMLQQTRVETVIPYYQRWMKQFPNVEALAQATLQDVLYAWEGLGYYGRARNLHKAAQQVLAEYQGEIPAEARLLQKLPGVGRYSAGAIASIAFGADEPALDGNIRRVLARLFDVSQAIGIPETEHRFWQLAKEHLPAGKAGEFNQALMDLGATICLPRAPKCDCCPLAHLCRAKALGVQEQRPLKAARPRIPHYTVTAAVIWHGNQVLITQRPPDGLLGGLWEFPGGKIQPGEDLAGCLQREIQEELEAGIEVHAQIGVYKHAYTHFKVTLHAFHCRLQDGSTPRKVQVNDLRWVETAMLKDFPMGKIDRQISIALQAQANPFASSTIIEEQGC